MRVLVLGPNYRPEPIGIAVYTTDLCEALVDAGHAVQVVTAKPHYPGWRVFEGWRAGLGRRTREQAVDVTRLSLYVPAQPSGAKRILHYLSFALSAGPVLLARASRNRPDVVIAIAPSLIAAPLAWLAARLSGAKCWLHIQDFELEAAFATGLMQQKGPVAGFAKWFERRVITLFDGVSSISPEMCHKLVEKGAALDSVYELRNWADVKAVQPLAAASAYRDEWNIRTPHVALYSGNIARKQGIEIVAEAASLLQHRADLSFVICGNGPERAALEASCAGLGNVYFHDLQPVERLPELLGLASIHLLPQKADAADLVLPSKLTNMLASGRPVVATAALNTGLRREVVGCGIATLPGDVGAFAAAIVQLIDDPALYRETSTAARTRAETAWAKDPIIGRFRERLAQLGNAGAPDGAVEANR